MFAPKRQVMSLRRCNGAQALGAPTMHHMPLPCVRSPRHVLGAASSHRSSHQALGLQIERQEHPPSVWSLHHPSGAPIKRQEPPHSVRSLIMHQEPHHAPVAPTKRKEPSLSAGSPYQASEAPTKRPELPPNAWNPHQALGAPTKRNRPTRSRCAHRRVELWFSVLYSSYVLDIITLPITYWQNKAIPSQIIVRGATLVAERQLVYAHKTLLQWGLLADHASNFDWTEESIFRGCRDMLYCRLLFPSCSWIQFVANFAYIVSSFVTKLGIRLMAPAAWLVCSK